MKLSERQRAALKICVDHPSTSRTAAQLYISPAQLAPLVRAGLLSSIDNSERVRGERRVHWREYRITPAGHQALVGASLPVEASSWI
jgi:hypothetical protein